MHCTVLYVSIALAVAVGSRNHSAHCAPVSAAGRAGRVGGVLSPGVGPAADEHSAHVVPEAAHAGAAHHKVHSVHRENHLSERTTNREESCALDSHFKCTCTLLCIKLQVRRMRCVVLRCAVRCGAVLCHTV